MSFDVNWLAVVVAALIPMGVGSLWYGPLFGKKWMELMGFTPEQIKEDLNPAKSYGGSLVLAVIMSLVLANIIGSGSAHGVVTAIILWLGFIVPHGWQSVAWEGKNLHVYLLNMGNNLVSLVLMGWLLSVWT